MRNLKKFLALVLAMIMVVSASAVVSADFTDVADSRYADAINDLAVKGIVKGTSDTTFGPDQDVKRWQMALFVARAMTGIVESDADWANGHVQYVDVTEYKGAIEYVHANGVINGWADPVNGDPVFGPNDGITYVQALKMAVCALGYDEQLEWPWGYYNKAATLGLTNNLVIGDINDTLNRAETAQVIYNMIYAAPANGGLTMAETNFSIKTPDNTTLFVVVATPNQYYSNSKITNEAYDAKGDVAGTWMGIQPLVNGIPNGQIIYLPCEKLGIAAGEVEDYFNRTVELVNYDAATGEFTGVELGAAPTIVNYNNVKISGAKLVYNGVTYTPSTSITGAALINELIVFDGAEVVSQAKVLPLNENGDIINGKGEVVASRLNNTNYWIDNATKYAMTEEDALDQYGVWVKGEDAEFVKYDTITASALNNKAYQLEMYDDNGDGDYERAIVRNIYMGVYHTELANIGNKEQEADGMLADLGYLKTASSVGYTYANKDTKNAQTNGAIVVYTYNPQRNRVNVLDVLEMKTGILTKVDGKSFDSHDNNAKNTVKLTFDGTTTLTLAYDIKDATDWTVDGAKLGAELIANDNKGKNDTVLDVADEAFLQYYYTTKGALTSFVETSLIGNEYAYYAYNGYIIMLDVIEHDEVFNFALMEEFVDFDFGEIYLNMYVGTEYEEEALVTVLDGKDLSKLSNYKFSMLISKQDYFYPGLLYEVEKAEDAYELDDLITVDNYTEYDLLDAKVAGTPDASDATKGTIVFDNGSTKGDVRSNRLRTNSDTVFFFIDDEVLTPEEIAAGETPDPMNATITPYYGNAGDNWIEYDADTVIWTDSLGTANDKAAVVYVYNAVAQNFTTTELDTVWVMMNLSSAHTTETVVAEDELGDAYDNYDFEGKYLYKYTGNFYDLDTGDKVPYILTEYRLNKTDSSFRLVEIDENNVAIVDKSGSTLSWNTNDQNFTYLTGTRDYAMYGIEDKNGNGSTVNDANWGKPNGSLNYFDWMYYHKMKIDVDGKELVPNSILEVALVEDIIEAEYDDGVAVITNLDNDRAICDEDDDITDVIVIDLNGKITKNEDALEYLMCAPQILYCSNADYMDDGCMVFVVATAVADK